MLRLATSLGIRRLGRTVIGLIGPYYMDEGTSIRAYPGAIRRTSGRGLVWVCVGTEGEAALLDSLLQNLRSRHGDDLEALAVAMARAWLVDPALRVVQAPVLLATDQRLVRVGPEGEVVEPSDGVAAIGYSSGLVMGAAKALLAHTTFEGEDVVRKSLQFAADCRTMAGANMRVEEV